MNTELLEKEGDVIEVIGYLSIEGVSVESFKEYLSAVSRYQELNFIPSPTKNHMVCSLVKAFGRSLENLSGCDLPCRLY